MEERKHKYINWMVYIDGYQENNIDFQVENSFTSIWFDAI